MSKIDIMDLNSQSTKDTDAKTVFHKPSNDTANRKYRRYSPTSGSSSYSESPEREQSASPIHPRKRDAKALDDKQRNDVERETERENRRNPYSRDMDTHRGFTDRHNKHDDHNKHHKHGDEDNHDRYQRSSSRSGRESRSSRHSGRRLEIENNKYEEHESGDERYYYYDFPKQRRKDREGVDRKKCKEKDPPHGRVSCSNVESRQHKKEYSEHRGDHKDSDGRKHGKDRKKTDEEENNGEKCQFRRDISSQMEDRSAVNDRYGSHAKNPKPSVKDNGEESRDAGEGNDIASSILTDVNAAKVAAMKAAELVNRNLSGIGGLSTEQKKKLLWGNKNTTAEESSHGWENAMFSDKERQEKFNKLMGVKGDLKSEELTGTMAEKQKEVQLDLEKQYTAGLRRRDGRTVGLGL